MGHIPILNRLGPSRLLSVLLGHSPYTGGLSGLGERGGSHRKEGVSMGAYGKPGTTQPGAGKTISRDPKTVGKNTDKGISK